jgi:signal transduction histidine kinase
MTTNQTVQPFSAIGRATLVTWVGVSAALLAVTAFHYGTSPEAVGSHNIYRRLYYLPIVWAAFAGGWRGGLLAAAAACLAYLPHAFFLHHHLDPAPTIDKALEMILYFGVGGLAGFLVDRERLARRREAQRSLAQLEAEARAERLDGLVHLSRGLAHEIRNPLGGLQGAIEILAEAVPEHDRRREMLPVALKECERLTKVLHDFLAFARPREPEPRAFDAAVLIAHVGDLLRSEAQIGRASCRERV